MSTLYESILSLCEEKGIKGGKMCVDLGISKSLMTDLKKGRKYGITAQTAQKIADYFGVSVGRVLGQENDTSLDRVKSSLSNNELEAWKTIQETATRILGTEPKEKPAPIIESELSSDEIYLIDLFRQLTDEDRDAVIRIMTAAAGRKSL